MAETSVPAAQRDPAERDSRPIDQTSMLPVFCVAAAVGLLHIFTNGRYGFHRDELQFLSDARHLDWGYVSYPP